MAAKSFEVQTSVVEIVYSKADHAKDNMGLTTWKNSPDGRILKSDISVAKNYLSEKEIKRLEWTVFWTVRNFRTTESAGNSGICENTPVRTANNEEKTRAYDTKSKPCPKWLLHLDSNQD